MLLLPTPLLLYMLSLKSESIAFRSKLGYLAIIASAVDAKDLWPAVPALLLLPTVWPYPSLICIGIANYLVFTATWGWIIAWPYALDCSWFSTFEKLLPASLFKNILLWLLVGEHGPWEPMFWSLRKELYWAEMNFFFLISAFLTLFFSRS